MRTFVLPHRFTVLPVALTALGVCTAGATVSPPARAAPPFSLSPSAPAPPLANRPIAHLALTLSRAESAPPPVPSGIPLPPPAILATPQLTTFDGETSSISVTAADLSYTLSLSPQREKPENGKPGTARILWNIRLAGKSLPGGVATVTLGGASRVVLDGNAYTIAEIALTDPQTGRISTYRLSSVTTFDSGETVAAPVPVPVTPVPTVGGGTPSP